MRQIVLLFLVLLLFSCSNEKENFYGNWQLVVYTIEGEHQNPIENFFDFNSNGKYNEHYLDKGEIVKNNGTWNIDIENKHIILYDGFESFEGNYTINDNIIEINGFIDQDQDEPFYFKLKKIK